MRTGQCGRPPLEVEAGCDEEGDGEDGDDERPEAPLEAEDPPQLPPLLALELLPPPEERAGGGALLREGGVEFALRVEEGATGVRAAAPAAAEPAAAIRPFSA